MPNRLENFDFTLKFKSEANLLPTDVISSGHYDDKSFEVILNKLESVQLNTLNPISVSPEKFEALRSETSKEKEFLELNKTTLEGRPKSKQKLEDYITPYFKERKSCYKIHGITNLKLCSIQNFIILLEEDERMKNKNVV